MLKKPKKMPTLINEDDILSEAHGGTPHHEHKPKHRIRTFLTEEHKLGGHTKYYTDRKRLYYKDKRLGKMRDLLSDD